MIENFLIQLIVLIVLAVFSWIDFKIQAIPSVLLTSVIFLTLALLPQNLIYGLLMLLLAVILYETNYLQGLADIKILSFIGLLMGSIFDLFLFMSILMFIGTVAKYLVFWRTKDQEKVYAFVPVIFISYLIYFLIISLR